MNQAKWEPFDVNGAIFRPKGRLMYVEEPEFGCEGAPDDGPICGSIVIEQRGEARARTVPIAADILFSGQMADGMWYGRLGGKLVLVGRDKQTVYQPNDAECAWLEAL